MEVVVTGGGTIAPIDDVRSIVNVSTGRFSAMISEACLRAGAVVHHIHSPTALLPFARDARLGPSADEADVDRLRSLVGEWGRLADRLHLVPLIRGDVAEYAESLRRVLTGREIAVAFLAMAVSDYEPDASPGKIPSDRGEWSLRMRPTPKVIRHARDWSPKTYLAGFKLSAGATREELLEQARAACVANRADLTIANDLESVRAGRHEVHLVRPGFEAESIGPGPDLAVRVVERVLRWAVESRS